MSSLTSSSAVSAALETAAAVWRSIGLELIIFLVTLFFALILRTSGAKKVAGQFKSVAGSNKVGFKSPPEKSIAPTSDTGAPASATAAKFGSTSKPVGGFLDRPQERQAYTRRPGKDTAQIIDEVVESMRDAPGTKTANKALSLYAEAPKDVRISEAARRSRHSAGEFYTTLVQCAIRVGKYHLVEGLLDDMLKQNVGRTLPFYESAMKQLAGQKHYHLALSMYDRLVSDGLEPSAVTYSCLISFAAEVGELQRALGFFDRLSQISTPSIRAYMTVLRVHAKRQDWPSSVTVFREMQKRKVQLDSLVLNVILATGVAADQLEGVEQLLVEADEFSPPIADVVSYNTLIKGYSQRSDSVKAKQVVARMRDRGLPMNAITFNTAMDAAVRSMRTQDAWDLLKDMRKSGFRPDKFTCSILVKGLSKSAQSDHIRNSLELLRQVDATCDATLRSTLYHSVLEAAAQVPDTVMLMTTFGQMRKHQVTLTASAYRLLVQALGQEGDATRCGEIWQQMLSEDIRPQASIFVALLESQLKAGQVDGALMAFDSLRSSIKNDSSARRIDSIALLEECRVAFIRSLCRICREPEATHIYLQARSDGALANIDSATGMMLARVQSDSGNLSHAWMTVEDMIVLGHRPNEATLHSFLNACTKQSHTVYAKALLQKANDQGIALSQATYTLFLKLFGRCQQLQEAMGVFEMMTEKQGVEATSQTMVALIRVCSQCRQPGKGLDLMEKFQAMAKDQPLDGVIYRAALACCIQPNLIPKGIALVEDAMQRGVSLPTDAIEVLGQAAQRRGQSGSAEFERLGQLAKELHLNLLPPEASSLGGRVGVSALAAATQGMA